VRAEMSGNAVWCEPQIFTAECFWCWD